MIAKVYFTKNTVDGLLMYFLANELKDVCKSHKTFLLSLEKVVC